MKLLVELLAADHLPGPAAEQPAFNELAELARRLEADCHRFSGRRARAARMILLAPFEWTMTSACSATASCAAR